jgi:hypothetical protein
VLELFYYREALKSSIGPPPSCTPPYGV